MDLPQMVHLGLTPLSHYQGTQDQDLILMLNGGTPYMAPELTSQQKAIVLYHHPEAIFLDRNLDVCPQPEPCPIAEALLIEQISHALAQPRNYQEYPLSATPQQEIEIGKWLSIYQKNPSSIITPPDRDSLMKPYERNTKPMDIKNKHYQMATNIIRTYANGENRHSISLCSAIASSNAEWIIQKMAKKLSWDSLEGQRPPINETIDEMAARWAAGDVSKYELIMLDLEEDMMGAFGEYLDAHCVAVREGRRLDVFQNEDNDEFMNEGEDGYVTEDEDEFLTDDEDGS